MRQETLLQPRDEEHRLQIVGETLAHAGADDLDGDLLLDAVAQHHGRMHLGDRGGGDRFAEMGIEIGDRAAERDLDGGARLLDREGRHAVLQEGQIFGEIGADDIGTGGQELADLHIGRPEPLDGAGEPVAAVLLPWRGGGQKDRQRIARAVGSAGRFSDGRAETTPSRTSTQPIRTRRA